MPLHVSSTCAHQQEVKNYITQPLVSSHPPDDEHMCSKHVEVRNKLILKQKFCASSRLITEINTYTEMHGQQNVKIPSKFLEPFFKSYLPLCIVI